MGLKELSLGLPANYLAGVQIKKFSAIPFGGRDKNLSSVKISILE